MRPVPLFAAFVLALGIAACGPLVMIPGGALSGQVRPAPHDWSFTDDVDTVQLETRTDDPYSVNVWGVGVGSRFYVAAGESGNRWAEHIAADPRVRLRIGPNLYEMKATATRDPDELEAFVAGVKRKYDWEPDAEQRAGATLFRLEPR